MTQINLPALSSDSDIKAYIRKISELSMLSLEEEQELAINMADGDISAAHKLVTSHLRLVVKIALSYKNYGLPVMDLISEGNIGLMKAVKKFDVSKGFRLSTYAIWWIKAQIQEYLLRSWSLVKIGTTANQKKLFFNLAKIKNKLLKYDQEHLSLENIKDISSELSVSAAEIQEMESRLTQGDVYIYDKTGSNEEEGLSLADRLASNEKSQEEIIAENQEKTQNITTLHQAINQLKDRERDILIARKLNDTPKTLEDLSQEYGVSKERVRQIEAKALEKIKKYFENN